MSDTEQKNRTRNKTIVEDIVSIQMTYDCTEEEFAGVLSGLAASYMHQAKIKKGEMIAVMSKCYDNIDKTR